MPPPHRRTPARLRRAPIPSHRPHVLRPLRRPHLWKVRRCRKRAYILCTFAPRGEHPGGSILNAMRLFRRETALSVPLPLPQAFAEWLLVATSGTTKLEDMDFAALERVCGNTSSLLIGAALAAPGTAAVSPADPATAGEHARLIARRTADGFSAALADRNHTVLAWPWDHIGTRVAWECLAQQRPPPRRGATGRMVVRLRAPPADPGDGSREPLEPGHRRP